MKEKIIKAVFNQKPQVVVRIIDFDDSDAIKKEKKKYPFKLHNDVIVTIETNKRKFSFKIFKNYIWNGADIPRCLWRVVGSKTDNAFLLASMVHDFMLQFKKYILVDVLNDEITIREYRRLTSLIFREILKATDTWVVKANIMSWCVDVFQNTIARHKWKLQEKT